MLLNLPNPSPDWRGLARVISTSHGLREDVTLVVESERLRFFDCECREIRLPEPSATWNRREMHALSEKISFLDWLHEQFPRQSGKNGVHH